MSRLGILLTAPDATGGLSQSPLTALQAQALNTLV